MFTSRKTCTPKKTEIYVARHYPSSPNQKTSGRCQAILDAFCFKNLGGTPKTLCLGKFQQPTHKNPKPYPCFRFRNYRSVCLQYLFGMYLKLHLFDDGFCQAKYS